MIEEVYYKLLKRRKELDDSDVLLEEEKPVRQFTSSTVENLSASFEVYIDMKIQKLDLENEKPSRAYMEWYFFFNLKKSTLKATKNYIDLFL
jgi:hypothetical protein